MAGIQPAALFGAEVVQADPKTIRALQGVAYKAGPIRPIGVPAEQARLWYPTQQLPEFKAIFAPIGRYAREAWLAAQLPGLTTDQFLTSHLTHIAQAVKKALAQDTYWNKAPCTIQALANSCRKLRWTLTDAFTFTPEDQNKHAMDIRQGSPKLLEAFAVEAFESMQNARMDEARTNKKLEPCKVDWHFVRTFIRHKKTSTEQKSVLLQLPNGTVTTPHWLNTHGFNIDPLCSCGAAANLNHWLEGCPDMPPDEGPEADEGEALIMHPNIWKPILAPEAVSKHPYSIPICSEGGGAGGPCRFPVGRRHPNIH